MVNVTYDFFFRFKSKYLTIEAFAIFSLFLQVLHIVKDTTTRW